MELLKQRLTEKAAEIKSLKADLTQLNSIIESPADFRENILQSINARDVLIEKLDQSMPDLKPLNTKALLNQNKGLSNDFLFRAIYDSFVTHNEDLEAFQQSSG
jgi:hypothetical protein